MVTGPAVMVDLIAGARPNFVKLAAIVRALETHRVQGGRLRGRIVHTGQHYDPRMSAAFFAQLGIPAPDVNLEVGSGSAAEQTAGIMLGYERLLAQGPRPAVTIVVGDVTSTMACAIVAQKAGVKVAHVEAGIRSGDWRMPEEINRLVTDAITDWFFTTSEYANANLRRAGVQDARIFFVGNTMIDTLRAQENALKPPLWVGRQGIEPQRYFLLTLHRPANVDDVKRLDALLHAVAAGAQSRPVVFPVHPRTRKVLDTLKRPLPTNLVVTEPQPYLEFNWLSKHAMGVITDSGGVTEEATVFGVPCVTLRDTTERPETVSEGTNELVGSDPDGVTSAMRRIQAGKWKSGRIPDRWDGMAGARIVAALAELTAL